MRNASMLTAAAALAALVSTTPVHATGNDVSYVDIGGFDGGNCTNDAADRCRTLARALAVTNAGGIIYCMSTVDNGSVPTLFGPITISQSVTIDCSNTNSSVAAAPVAITISGAATVVTLRGLRIHGVGSAGIIGISVTSGAAVILDNVQIEHMRGPGSGIVFAPSGATGRLDVSNSFISDTGGNVSTAGILIRPTSGGSANISVNRTELKGNANGIFVDNSGGGAVNLSVRDSLVTGSSNVGIVVATPGPGATALLDRTTVNSSFNVGVAASGAAAIVRIGNSTIYGNVTGVAAFSGASIRSYKNNQINGNGTDGTPLTAEAAN
jgi:hypothetical protein